MYMCMCMYANSNINCHIKWMCEVVGFKKDSVFTFTFEDNFHYLSKNSLHEKLAIDVEYYVTSITL